MKQNYDSNMLRLKFASKVVVLIGFSGCGFFPIFIFLSIRLLCEAEILKIRNIKTVIHQHPARNKSKEAEGQTIRVVSVNYIPDSPHVYYQTRNIALWVQRGGRINSSNFSPFEIHKAVWQWHFKWTSDDAVSVILKNSTDLTFAF